MIWLILGVEPEPHSRTPYWGLAVPAIVPVFSGTSA